jgi:hypothetical protein
VLLVAAVVVWFLPEEPLRSVSGIQARHQDEERLASEAAAVSTGSSQMVDGEALTEDSSSELSDAPALTGQRESDESPERMRS